MNNLHTGPAGGFYTFFEVLEYQAILRYRAKMPRRFKEQMQCWLAFGNGTDCHHMRKISHRIDHRKRCPGHRSAL